MGCAAPCAVLKYVEEDVGAFVLLTKPIDFNALTPGRFDIALRLFAPKVLVYETPQGGSPLVSAATWRNALSAPSLRANPISLHVVLRSVTSTGGQGA